MSFRGRKTYGQSQITPCPFCSEPSFVRNAQGIPVCNSHKDEAFPDVKCSCGSWLDRKEGKYGTFFVCANCGTVNMRKAISLLNMSRR